jgi:regulator of protease activity HflC (stomatin/prohibitin superfamily)
MVDAGITWLRRFERVNMVVYLPPRAEPISAKEVTTLDNMVIAQFDISVFHRANRGNETHSSGQYRYDRALIQEKIWSPNGGDWRGAVKSIAESALRDVVARYNLDEIYAISGDARQALAIELKERINLVLDQFLGVEAISVDVGAIKVSDSVKKTLEDKGLAEVKRQTQMINSEAEKEKLVREAEGKATQTRLVETERAKIRESFIKQLATPLVSDTGEPLASEETASRYIGVLVRFLDILEAVLGPDELDRLLSVKGRSRT